MSTKVQEIEVCTNISAEIFQGTKVYAQDGEMYAIHNKVRMQFKNLPSSEKRTFIKLYMADKIGQAYIKTQFGIMGFESSFKKWMLSKFGSIENNHALST